MDLQKALVGGFRIKSGGSHCQEHEHADGGSDNEDIVGDEEGEVGDDDEEEGGDEGRDAGALHSPDQVQIKTKIYIVYIGEQT